ncbi:TonB-dependent receptor [Novosphingobium sp.]|uniref:TonB-dependent receptor n=1 Tax=Novosphingobium sp. TaxID=1874826 RepID=UPI00273642B6|nr:TonB-dependent receptor [Novosphingobium sp.]MDP3906569.1 TonB-dependent receptor [Novosphingobium sp.]
MRCALIPVVLLALPVSAHAETGDDSTIVVTGQGLERTAEDGIYGVQVIPPDRLARAASGRLEDVLSSVAGFQQFRRSDSRSANPSAQGVTFRGLGGNASSRTLVLLDGVPQADPFFGYIPFSGIAPERLSRVLVTRGGGSGAFGAGAVAGTIELLSAGADDLDLLNASALVNDRGESELSVTLAPKLGSGFAVLSGRWDRGQGFWTTPVAQRVAASTRARYDSWSAGLRAVAPLTDTIELQVRGLAYDDQRTLRFAGADSATRGQDASVRLVGKGDWQFDALAYVQARDFSNIVISSTSFRKTLHQRRTPATGIGGKLELRPPVGGSHELRLGADWRSMTGRTQEEAYSGVTGLVTARRRAGGRNTDLGLFVEDSWTLGALTLTGGLRADRWTIRDGYFTEANAAGTTTVNNAFANRAGWDVSWRGGARVQAAEGLALRGAAYTSLRQPTLNELYRPFAVFPVTTRANAALRNEELLGFEAGVDLTPTPGVTLNLTAFDNKVKNAIANVTIGTNLRERRNVDAVRSRGVELAASATLGTVRFDGSLALTDAQVQASGASLALDGKRPAQVAKLAASASLAWMPRDGWLLSATLRHIGAQYEDDLETGLQPAATTLDAVVKVPLGRRFAVVLRGENLTDATIVTRNQGGSIDLGTPRTVWAGLSVSIGR